LREEAAEGKNAVAALVRRGDGRRCWPRSLSSSSSSPAPLSRAFPPSRSPVVMVASSTFSGPVDLAAAAVEERELWELQSSGLFSIFPAAMAAGVTSQLLPHSFLVAIAGHLCVAAQASGRASATEDRYSAYTRERRRPLKPIQVAVVAHGTLLRDARERERGNILPD